MPRLSNNQTITGRVIEDLPLTLGDVLRTQFRQSFRESGMSAFFRSMEMSDALSYEEVPTFDIDSGTYSTFTPARIDRGPMYSTEEANERGKGYGLTFEEPTPVAAFDILVRRKKQALAAESVYASGPAAPAIRLFTGFLANAVDPLNVATAFIPVVGEARWAAALGRTGQRLTKGAIEGAVGAAMLEPIVYYAAQQEQADYNMMDSLLNVTFGTVLGGGLHVVVGKAGDIHRARKVRLDAARGEAGYNAARVESLNITERADTLRSVVAQAEQDITPNADAFLSRVEEVRHTPTPSTRELPDLVSVQDPVGAVADTYPVAGAEVDGRTVLSNIDNRASIAATSDDMTEVVGVREIPMSELENPTFKGNYVAANDRAHVDRLKQQILESKTISPLIVVADSEGLYVLEGAHRMVALHELGAKSFPAVVAVDNADLADAKARAQNKAVPDARTIAENEVKRMANPENDLFAPQESPTSRAAHAERVKESAEDLDAEQATALADEAVEEMDAFAKNIDPEILEGLGVSPKSLSESEILKELKSDLERIKQQSEIVEKMVACLQVTA